MNKKFWERTFHTILATIAANTMFTVVAVSAQNYTAPIAALQPPSNYQDCVFFTLVGIPQADPVVPNNPWFALSPTQIGYSEMYAALLAAKLSGSTLNVVTTGAAGGGGCTGFAGIAYIILP